MCNVFSFEANVQLKFFSSPTWREPYHENTKQDFCPCVFLKKQLSRRVDWCRYLYGTWSNSHGSTSEDIQTFKQSGIATIPHQS